MRPPSRTIIVHKMSPMFRDDPSHRAGAPRATRQQGIDQCCCSVPLCAGRRPGLPLSPGPRYPSPPLRSQWAGTSLRDSGDALLDAALACSARKSPHVQRRWSTEFDLRGLSAKRVRNSSPHGVFGLPPPTHPLAHPLAPPASACAASASTSAVACCCERAFTSASAILQKTMQRRFPKERQHEHFPAIGALMWGKCMAGPRFWRAGRFGGSTRA